MAEVKMGRIGWLWYVLRVLVAHELVVHEVREGLNQGTFFCTRISIDSPHFHNHDHFVYEESKTEKR